MTKVATIQIRPLVPLSLCTILVLIVACGALLIPTKACAEPLYFLSGQPSADLPGPRPYPLILYRFDSVSSGLDSVWSLPEGSRVENIRLFPGQRVIQITEGYTPSSLLLLLSTESAMPVARYDLDSLGTVLSVKEYDNGEPLGQLAITYTPDIRASHASEITTTFSPGRVSSVLANSTEHIGGEQRLSTVASYGSSKPDRIFLPIITDTLPQTRSEGLVTSAFPVPDSIIHMKTSFGWTMFAQEPGFLGLHSIPERNGLMHTEVLIYNRLSRRWTSILLPGTETRLRHQNGWIVGNVAYSDPRTDWSKRMAFLSVPTDTTILINPLTLTTIVVNMGGQFEVLWIEGNCLYYRTSDSLYRARIDGSALVDHQLLLSDPKAENIHWAFRGGLNP